MLLPEQSLLSPFFVRLLWSLLRPGGHIVLVIVMYLVSTALDSHSKELFFNLADIIYW